MQVVKRETRLTIEGLVLIQLKCHPRRRSLTPPDQCIPTRPLCPLTLSHLFLCGPRDTSHLCVCPVICLVLFSSARFTFCETGDFVRCRNPCNSSRHNKYLLNEEMDGARRTGVPHHLRGTRCKTPVVARNRRKLWVPPPPVIPTQLFTHRKRFPLPASRWRLRAASSLLWGLGAVVA